MVTYGGPKETILSSMVAIKKIQPLSSIRADYKTSVYAYSNSPRARQSRRDVVETAYLNTPKNTSNFFMSPLYPAKFMIKGKEYKSVAHYVASQKHRGNDAFLRVIESTESPMDALLLGKAKYMNDNDNDERIKEINMNIVSYTATNEKERDLSKWNRVRGRVFLYATYCKFNQNPDLREALMETYPSPIIEDTLDPYWGTGRKNRKGVSNGLNMAGNQLVCVRNQFIKESIKKEEEEEVVVVVNKDCSS